MTGNEKVDRFTQEMRVKLDAAEQRVRQLKANAQNATASAQADGRRQLDVLEQRAHDHHAKVRAGEARASEWLQHKKAATTEKIAEWKQARRVDKLGDRADSAEQYLVTAVQLASASIDEAERAAVEAVVARMDADAARDAAARPA
jgi:hypothetical protein